MTQKIVPWRRISGEAIVIIVSATMLLTLAQSRNASAEDIEQTVRCAETRFSLSAESRDLEDFKSFIHPNARFVGQQIYRGPAEVAEAWAPFFSPDGPSIRWRPEIVEVIEEQGLAMTRGPYAISELVEGEMAITQWGTFNSVWIRSDQGSWNVMFDAGMPGQGEITEEARALLYDSNDC